MVSNNWAKSLSPEFFVIRDGVSAHPGIHIKSWSTPIPNNLLKALLSMNRLENILFSFENLMLWFHFP
jgi:hypothetical protein